MKMFNMLKAISFMIFIYLRPCFLDILILVHCFGAIIQINIKSLGSTQKSVSHPQILIYWTWFFSDWFSSISCSSCSRSSWSSRSLSPTSRIWRSIVLISALSFLTCSSSRSLSCWGVPRSFSSDRRASFLL